MNRLWRAVCAQCTSLSESPWRYGRTARISPSCPARSIITPADENSLPPTRGIEDSFTVSGQTMIRDATSMDFLADQMPNGNAFETSVLEVGYWPRRVGSKSHTNSLVDQPGMRANATAVESSVSVTCSARNPPSTANPQTGQG